MLQCAHNKFVFVFSQILYRIHVTRINTRNVFNRIIDTNLDIDILLCTIYIYIVKREIEIQFQFRNSDTFWNTQP